MKGRNSILLKKTLTSSEFTPDDLIKGRSRMTKRDRIYNKFNGLCGYTGQPLGEDWQIDHIFPKHRSHLCVGSINDNINLFPCLKIVNHYKRGLDIEGFRNYLSTLHIRLSRVPKNPRSEKRIKYKEYMLNVARAFGITTNIPFSGKFYFEIINNLTP